MADGPGQHGTISTQALDDALRTLSGAVGQMNELYADVKESVVKQNLQMEQLHDFMSSMSELVQRSQSSTLEANMHETKSVLSKHYEGIIQEMKFQQQSFLAKLSQEIFVASQAPNATLAQPTLSAHSSRTEAARQAEGMQLPDKMPSARSESMPDRSENEAANNPFSDRPSFNQVPRVSDSLGWSTDPALDMLRHSSITSTEVDEVADMNAPGDLPRNISVYSTPRNSTLPPMSRNASVNSQMSVRWSAETLADETHDGATSRSSFEMHDIEARLSSRSFSIRAVWVGRHSSALERPSRMASAMRNSGRDSGPEGNSEAYVDEEQFAASKEVEYVGPMRSVVALPDSQVRATWEALGICLVMHDVVTLPLLVFEIPDNEETDVINWIALVYWTMNVGHQCTVGYTHAGLVVMDHAKILKQYLKTWCIIDILALAPDWFFTLSASLQSSDSADSSELVRLVRIQKMVRLVRLLRLGRLRKAWNYAYEVIDSESLGIVANLTKTVLALLLVNHFVACMWFLVGDMQTGTSWIKFHRYTLPERTWSYQYWTAYHWSITQFTPASMHVQPQSEGERVFAITVIILGVVAFSYLVGSITASLAQLRAMSEDASKESWALKKYLKKYGVPNGLRHRILDYFDCQGREHRRQNHKTPALLQSLTAQLQHELQNEILGPTLCIHPLFKRLQDFSAVMCGRIAMIATSTVTLARHEHLFSTGERASQLSFVVTGEMQYSETHRGAHEKIILDKRKDWISEPVLWIDRWMHVGDMLALDISELLSINRDQFSAEVKRTPVAMRLFGDYAKNYVNWMKADGSVPLPYFGIEFTISDLTQGEVMSSTVAFLIPSTGEFDPKAFGIPEVIPRVKHSLTDSVMRMMARRLSL